MKKIITFLTVLFVGTALGFSQMNISVDIKDSIYEKLDYYQMKGFCSYMSGAKPYTVSRIFDAIDEILAHEDELSEVEISNLEAFKAKYVVNKEKKNNAAHVVLENNSDKWHTSFLYNLSLDTTVSGGIYNDSSFNQAGFDFISSFYFRGDITKWISYDVNAFFDFSDMPLYDCTENGGDYRIGYYWYEEGCEDYQKGRVYTEVSGKKVNLNHDDNGYYYMEGDNRTDVEEANVKKYSAEERTIKKFRNNSYLPYSYHKPWAGQIYFLTNMTADGLEGWATEPGISGGLNAEIRTSLFDNKFSFGAGRKQKEWAGMDNGSSLVLNTNAAPFFEFDTTIEVFPWLHFSTLVGSLEYPNQDYINDNAFSSLNSGKDDSLFFQNGFSINMIDLDWKYLHIDFGSNVIWPKRFELGYLFPLFLYVEYQNHIGDYDNMALFGDIKLRKPGLGSIWASIYLDELNITSNWFTNTRVMFAGQMGMKVVIPFLPCGSLSMRYTKIEPYCYTHHSINYTPWYNNYLCEAYVNGGESLGYYLDPNSDEFFLKVDSEPWRNSKLYLQYQFIRHGADYGSQQVPGSSYYSEMQTKNRDELRKYFLHDGAYNWIHIVSIGASRVFNTKSSKTVELNGNAGFLYSYYTMIDEENFGRYDEDNYGNNGNCKNADSTTNFYYVNTDEYPVQWGVVLTAGIKIKF